MSKRVIPMAVAPPPSLLTTTPLPPTLASASLASKQNKGTKLPMDRFAMMRQVNLETSASATAVDTVSAGQNHRERLQQESRRRVEVVLMEKEDYTFTQEGVDRLKRQEARLVMQDEDKRMRQLMKDEAAVKYQALERERRRIEAEERQVLLEKHRVEMEAQKAKQDADNERKRLEREERMRKMKEASDRKAREEYLANEAVKKAALERERQAQQEQMERLHMEIEDEAERCRMQRAAEEALIQAKVAAEEAKWKAWEEAEAAREASEQAARRAQKAAQYEADKKRRMDLHRLRKETENRLKRIEAMDHPTPLPPPPSRTPDSPSKSVPKIGSFCLNPSVEKPTTGDFKDIAAMSKDELREEHNTCVQLKKTIKQDIVSWCDAFQAKLGRPPTLEEKTEIQPLYKRYSDVEAHLRLVKHRLEGLVAQEKAKKAQEASVFHQLSAAAESKATPTLPPATLKPTTSRDQLHAILDSTADAAVPSSDLDQLTTRKKTLKQEIQDWCTQFQSAHGRPPTIADKKDVQGLYEEYAALDARIKALNSAETVLMAPSPTAAAVLPGNLSLADLVNLVHDALDDPTPLAPRDLAQRILAIHEAMDGQKCSPFLRVDGVESESPAAQAGLQVGDLIGRFGTVVAVLTATHSNLIRQVVTVVNARVGKGVSISLQRGSSSWRHLVLKPQKWRGKGLLGCVLQPYEAPGATQPALVSISPPRPVEPSQPHELDLYEALTVPLPEPMMLPLGDLVVWHHKLLDGMDSLASKESMEAMKTQMEATMAQLTVHIQRLMTESHAIPFLKVESVETSSPSALAGLEPGDLLGRVGYVMYYNGATHATLIKEMVGLVNDRTNHGISISFLRRNRTWRPLVLRPQKWSGQGLLGCILHPFDAPERVKKLASTLKLSPTATQPIPPPRVVATVPSLPSQLTRDEPAPEPATQTFTSPTTTDDATMLTETPPKNIADECILPADTAYERIEGTTSDVACEHSTLRRDVNESMALRHSLVAPSPATEIPNVARTADTLGIATDADLAQPLDMGVPSITNQPGNLGDRNRAAEAATTAVTVENCAPKAFNATALHPTVSDGSDHGPSVENPRLATAGNKVPLLATPETQRGLGPDNSACTDAQPIATEEGEPGTPSTEPIHRGTYQDTNLGKKEPSGPDNDASSAPTPEQEAIDIPRQQVAHVEESALDDALVSPNTVPEEQGSISPQPDTANASSQEPEGSSSHVESQDHAKEMTAVAFEDDADAPLIVPQWPAPAERFPASTIEPFDALNETTTPATDDVHESVADSTVDDAPYNFPVEAFGVFEEVTGNAARAGLEGNDYLVWYDGMPAATGGPPSSSALLNAFSKCTAFPLRLHIARWNVDALLYETHDVELESWDGVGIVLPIVAADDATTTTTASSSSSVAPPVDNGGAFAQINAVYDTSPADNGGLMVGDLVFWITDLPVFPTLDSVSDWIGAMYSAAQAVEIHVYRYSVDDSRYDELVLQIQPDRWCAPQLHLSSAVRRNVELLGVDLIFFDIPVPQTIYTPFLLVEHVIDGSPAADAGLVAGDWVGKIGQLTASSLTTRPADDVMGQAHLYIDKAMPVQLGRFDRTTQTMHTFDVTLRPQTWDGEGLVGCQLSPWSPQDLAPFLVVELRAPQTPCDSAIQEGDLVLRVGDYVHSASMQEVSLYVDSRATVLLVLQRWDSSQMAYTTFPVIVASPPTSATAWTLDGIEIGGWCCAVYETYWARYEEAHPAELPCKECWATTFSTVAHAAAYAGHDPCLRYLGECFDVFVMDSFGRTPLFYACYANQVDCIQLLLTMDCSNLKEAIDANGDTPLHAATSGGALAAIALLLQAGCNPEPINYSGMRPVHVAPSADTLQALAAGAADLLALDGSGRTALSYACMTGDEASVQYLVAECTEFIDFPDPEGDTPLHFAVAGGFFTCVQAIVAAASPKYVLRPNKAQQTALDVARANPASTAIAQYLEQTCVVDESTAVLR
ncbi:hypothetical protein H310_12946 [Aphanomyces invadans]|uniref:PDZ domain-containing protein n=1 Tax=Aphanomyces invadans TaxID=157072 RepID=A0A024TG37_9STRA|nr:hypothetical protein H310_12946 [Aphanomyces invadans]ETV92949.1 hypothetical protein H310_12946 [Aphanomyces invadans]|eukprot:XP_008878470.1 hypothetical protein H310_12946 [Aphanomyces invadans]